MQSQTQPDHLSLDWFRRLRPSKVFVIALLMTAITSVAATWVAITGATHPHGDHNDTLSWLVTLNAGFLLVLFSLISHRVFGLYRAMRRGSVGSRLQRRIVLIFSLVTIIPTVIVSLFSALFLHLGIETWFDERVQTALEESVAVAEAYLKEHENTIRADALAMASDIKRELPIMMTSPASFAKLLSGQSMLRNLSEAIVFQPGRVVARTELSFSLAFEHLPQHVLDQADRGDIVVMSDGDDKIRALIQLDAFGDLYLLIGRMVDTKVLNHMVGAQTAVDEYRRLRSDIGNLQIQFSLLFMLVVMMLLLAAIWYGMYVAMRLVVPISRLIRAAEKVRAGDYTEQVPVSSKDDEISTLGRTFNRMTQQLEKQRAELVEANRQLDERRRFTEAVFAGVSAGVIALNARREIMLNNRSAAQLLQDDSQQSMKGMPIVALMTEIAPLLDQAEARAGQLAEDSMNLKRGKKRLNLHVRVSAEMKDGTANGFIVTFDDVTELVSAQRHAAWADVARRIAHEIKNPLTPITLSTERLRKKYLAQLASDEDREAFTRYTDTISRHVKDIGSMVEEFASFARMPSAVLAEHDLRRTVNEGLFSAKTAYPKIRFHTSLPDSHVMLHYDERQIAQVLTNLLKNAAEGIEARLEQQGEHAEKGTITISVSADDTQVKLVVDDNGIGFPADKINTLTEPYVTTRAKGTGLGLAIVKKHLEEHKGHMELSNLSGGGARVSLSFPLLTPTE